MNIIFFVSRYSITLYDFSLLIIDHHASRINASIVNQRKAITPFPL